MVQGEEDEDGFEDHEAWEEEEEEEDDEDEDNEDEEGLEEAEDFIADLPGDQELDMFIPQILGQGGFGGIGGQPTLGGLQPPNQVRH